MIISKNNIITNIILYAALVLAVVLFAAADAFAQVTTNTPMGAVLCNVVDFFLYGNLGKGLATAAVCVVGVAATLGKVTWGMAIMVGVGIAIIFGAPSIVYSVTGGYSAGCG